MSSSTRTGRRWNLHVGDAPTLDQLRRFTDCMADLTIELIEGGASSLAQQLYLTPPAATSGKGAVLMLSGGIGHYVYNPVPIHAVSEVADRELIQTMIAASGLSSAMIAEGWMRLSAT